MSFTASTLPALANWAQIIGSVSLITGVSAAYHHHKCQHCWRWGRYRIGSHHVPTCQRHRKKEQFRDERGGL